MIKRFYAYKFQELQLLEQRSTHQEIDYFYLPPYSPHLDIIERLWKEIKARWLNEKDYQND